MNTIYIKELENKEEIEWISKVPKWGQTFLYKIIKKLNYIIVNKIEEKDKIYLIPNIEKKRVYQNLRKKLKKEVLSTQKIQIVLSKKMKKYKKEFEKYKIVDGKRYFLLLVENVLEKVLKEKTIAMQEIFLLTNKYNEQSVYIIKQLAPKVKNMNIITKEIEKYKALEEIMQDKGITVCIANNKRKSLKKAKIILNLNLTKEELDQYIICRNALLINLNQEKIMNLKAFEGIIIQDIEIEEKEEEKQWREKYNLKDSFRQLELIESRKENQIKEEKIDIIELWGNNGKITQKELINWQNILTN